VACSPAAGRLGQEVGPGRGLADPAGAADDRHRPALDAAAEQRVEFGNPRPDPLDGEVALVGPGHQPRVHLDAGPGDAERVAAGLEVRAAELQHRQRATRLRAVQRDRSIAEVLEVLVGSRLGRLGREKHRRPAVLEVAHQPGDLLSELVVVGRQVLQLGERVDEHPVGVRHLDGRDDAVGHRLVVDLVGREDAVLRLVEEPARVRAQVEYLDAVEVEPERRRVLVDVARRLLEGDEQAVLAGVDTRGQVVEPENRLAGPCPAPEHVRPRREQAAVEHLVGTVDAERDARISSAQSAYRSSRVNINPASASRRESVAQASSAR